MDIDVRNLQDELPRILADIKECDFIAFDLEFSGLYGQAEDQATKFDALEDLYQKCKHLCQIHHILQFGLVLFRWRAPRYEAILYNFYLSPPDGLQHFQTSSYKFLGSTGFDFNRVFAYGLDWHRIGLKQSPPKLNRQKFNSFAVESILKTLEQQTLSFMNDDTKRDLKVDCVNDEVVEQFLSYNYQEKTFKGYPRFQAERIKGTTSMLHLKKQKIAKTFGVERMQLEKRESEFNVVIESLIASGKILVGHHSCIDLCLVIHHFAQELPPTFLEYSKLVHDRFPMVMDTKLLSNHLRRDLPKIHSYVEGMYKDCFESDDLLRKFNNVELKSGDGKLVFHNAAYDAFVTGAFLVCYNNYQCNRHPSSLQQIEFKKIDFSIFSPFMNQLYSGTDITFNFDQATLNTSMQAISHIQPFQLNTIYYEDASMESLGQLVDHLRNYGSIEVNPITIQSGYIYFTKSMLNNLEDIMKQYQSSNPKLFHYDKRKIFKAQ